MEPLFFIVAGFSIIALGAFLGRFVKDDDDMPATVGGSAHDYPQGWDYVGGEVDVFD